MDIGTAACQQSIATKSISLTGESMSERPHKRYLFGLLLGLGLAGVFGLQSQCN